MIASNILRISIAIPTRNRSYFLDKLLEGLLRQTVDHDIFEIIIVDNASTDGTEAVARMWGSRFANFTYLVEKRTGIAYARNTAWRSARSDLVAFLDDDAIPDPEWLQGLADTYDNFWDGEQLIVIGGGVRPYPIHGGTIPPWLGPEFQDYWTRLDLGRESRVLVQGEKLVGANFSLPRATLEAIGGYNENMYHYGGDERWIEDEVLQRGGVLVYSGQAWVNHAVPAERLEPGWFYRRMIIEGKSQQRRKSLRRGDPIGLAMLRLGKAVVKLCWHLPFNLLGHLGLLTRFIFKRRCLYYFYRGSITDLAGYILRGDTIRDPRSPLEQH